MSDMIRKAHCAKRIAHLLQLLKEEFDDFCDAAGLIQKEVNNDSDNRVPDKKLGGDSSRSVASGATPEGGE